MPHILKAGPTFNESNMDIWNTSKMQPYTATGILVLSNNTQRSPNNGKIP